MTDGVLLGSYKFGGMLDWDADVASRLASFGLSAFRPFGLSH